MGRPRSRQNTTTAAHSASAAMSAARSQALRSETIAELVRAGRSRHYTAGAAMGVRLRARTEPDGRKEFSRGACRQKVLPEDM